MASIPLYVDDALTAIYEGSTADAQESMTLEFKEDRSFKTGDKRRAGLVEKLIDESVCMANSDVGSGYIIVGVADKVSGPEAFTGTQLDPIDIRQRIFSHTVPNMRVFASSVERFGSNLLIIEIPEALALYSRKSGSAKRRIDDGQFSCAPMTEEERRAIDLARRNTDFSNTLSPINISDLRLEVIEETRRILRVHRENKGEDLAIAQNNFGLLRELGVVTEEGILKKAGEILLADPAPTEVTIRHLWREIPGDDPVATEISDPLVLALPRLRRLIAENSSQEIDRVLFDNGQETAISRFPGQAIDEVISNAVIHRDWQDPRPVVIEQSRKVLKVTSPGSLPPGVKVNKLLTMPSVPRNNRLMGAMRTLGLAEENSRGFDRMWAAMIRTGREVPEVTATSSFVSVILAAQQPDISFIKGLNRLADEFGDRIINNVNTLIVLWHLNASPVITRATAKLKTQTSDNEISEFMDVVQSCGILTQLSPDEWVLSDKARELLSPQTNDAMSVEEWINGRLKARIPLTSADIASYAGISAPEAGRILQHLKNEGRIVIDPTGPARGRGTRWIRA